MQLRIHPASSHNAELRVLSPRTYALHNNSSKLQQSQPNSFAVAIVIVALGRSLYLLCFPAAFELVSASTVVPYSDQRPNPQLHLYLNPPRSQGCQPSSSFLSTSQLKTSGTRSAVSKKSDHSSCAISTRDNPRDIRRTANPLHVGLLILQIVL